MGIFEKLLRRKDTEPSMVPIPEDFMNEMSPGVSGPNSYGMGGPGQSYMDPLSMSSPQIGPYRDNIDMVGLAGLTIDNREVIEDFRSKLRGYKLKKNYNSQTQKETIEKVKFGEPFCSDDGINEISGDLEMFLSKIFILSNVPKSKDKMINNMVYDIAIDTAIKIVMNTENWKVDKTRRSTVMNLFIFTIWSNIMRGWDDGERIKLYQSQKHMINTNIMPGMNQPEKKNLFGF